VWNLLYSAAGAFYSTSIFLCFVLFVTGWKGKAGLNATDDMAYQFKWQETWSAGVVGGLSLMAIWLGFRSVSGLELSQGQKEDLGQDSSSRDAGGKV